MRSRGEIEQVLAEAMVEPSDRQRPLLAKRLADDELLAADEIMADLRVSYGHAEHPGSGGAQCQSCGEIDGSNKAVLWAFHPGELFNVAD